jgi:hypothetical protein
VGVAGEHTRRVSEVVVDADGVLIRLWGG